MYPINNTFLFFVKQNILVKQKSLFSRRRLFRITYSTLLPAFKMKKKHSNNGG